MFLFNYDTRITKDKLFVCIHSSNLNEAFDKFCQLIPEATEVTFCQRFF